LKTNEVMTEVQLIADALAKKSKKTLASNRPALIEQAKFFAPEYRDFILKIIKSSALKIESKPNGGSISDIDPSHYLRLNYTKRRKYKIITDIENVRTLPHELGHAVDFWFHILLPSSSFVNAVNNQTLYDVFTAEFNSKYEEFYTMIMNEYEAIITANIDENTFALIRDNIEKYRELKSIKIDKKNKETTAKRRALQKTLYECNFVETYFNIHEQYYFKEFNNKYAPILDALSSKYDLSHIFLAHHKKEYYDLSMFLPVQEFFANAFRDKVTANEESIANLKKYLPASYAAFENLFYMFYDRLQNNKKFTDVELIGCNISEK